jgi:succinate dehydrogenase / fumarate reductase flavoprotein subunit
METSFVDIGGLRIKTVSLNTAVVGTGAAGYNAALRLEDFGTEDTAIVTEGVNCGTSRNTGSDKQTYYKLSLSGDSPDSPAKMAANLFDGKCVDGDVAYAEAALSVRCFLHLAELGVPFPVNRLGEYVGYKTDHDPYERATSAGPLTSKLMTECLQKEAEKRRITVLDRLLVIKILKSGGRVCGLLTLDLSGADPDSRFVLIRCKNVIFCTGGPAGIYADTVYPAGHFGSSGLMFEAGAKGKNLTEWQYGLASVHPRWNVSGTYMQVLPTFVSVDESGKRRWFLEEYFGSAARCCSAVFRKGYEWPFDSRRAQSGSSVVDLLVYRETVLRGRKVYLDFRRNPFGLAGLPYDEFDPEARGYLEKAGACFGTPLERLEHMNKPAVELYSSKGVDISKEDLEIALCAQHCNGGVAVDLWWQTDVPGLFAAGEAACTHGVRRPGGSALNAGQVGSLRAAQYISRLGTGEPCPAEEFVRAAQPEVQSFAKLCAAFTSGGDNVITLMRGAQGAFTRAAGAIRDPAAFAAIIEDNRSLLARFGDTVRASSSGSLANAFRLREILISQITVLSAMLGYAGMGGKSRGSAILRTESGVSPDGMEEFKFEADSGELDGQVQEILYSPEGCSGGFRPVHPLPEGGGFFENVWRRFREDGNVY